MGAPRGTREQQWAKSTQALGEGWEREREGGGSTLPANSWLPGRSRAAMSRVREQNRGGVFPACQVFLYTEAEGGG